MKKNVLLMLGLTSSSLAYSQVGFNTATPNSTVDITAKNSTGKSTNVDGLLIPRVDRERAQNMTGVPVSTMIFVSSIATGTQAGLAANIDATGYYFFDGTAWIKIGTRANSHIYNSDGSLTANRTVQQDDKKLAFTGSTVNAFSVDGTTLSVDAENNRVGIGTTTPKNALDLGSKAGDSITDPAGKKLAVYNNSAGSRFYGLGVSSGRLQFHAGAAKDAAPTMVLSDAGRLGVGTTDPAASLDVKGNILGIRSTNYGSWDNIWFKADSTAPSINTSGAESGLRFNVGRNSVGTYGDSGQVLQTVATMLPNGNMGIGTTAPTHKLHVQGSVKIADGTQGANKVLTSDANGLATWKEVPAANDTNVYNNDGTLSANRTVAQGDKTLAFTGSAANAFSVDGTTLSVNASNDRVGIGTISPAAKLDIAGNIKIADGTQGANKVLTSDANGVATWKEVPAANDTNVYNNDGTLSANRTVAQGDKTLAFTGSKVNAFSVDETTLSVDALNNRVGIGTTTPKNALDFGDNAGDSITDPAGKKLAIYNNKDESSFYGLGVSSGRLQFHAAAAKDAAPTMVLSDAGRLGIGTTNPAAKLDIAGNIKIADGTQGANKVLTSDANGVATWKTPAASTDTNVYNTDGTLSANRTVAQGDKTLAFTGSAANAFSVDGTTLSVNASNDRVGIGTISPAAKLDIAGNIKIADGTQGANKVLTSDANGVATWKEVPDANDTNVYNNDGTLSANRTVAQGDKTLAFTGSAVNAFSVDGTTLSVDAENNNVGIGTTAPDKRFDVLDISDKNQYNGIASFSAQNRSRGVSIGYDGIQSIGTLDDVDLNLNSKGTGNVILQNKNVNATGKVGIGTVTPVAKLDIVGNIKIADGTQGADKVLTSDANGLATWKTPAASSDINFYKDNGTLTANRTVAQGDKTLAFTGSAANAFSVDGTTLSVDALNNRVGIGTNAPKYLMDLGNSNGKKLSLYDDANGGNFYGFGIGSSSLDFYTAADASKEASMVIKNTGNVGIGTAAPETKQDIRTGNRAYGLQHTDGTVKLRTYVGATTSNGNTEAGWIGTYSNHPVDLMTNDAPRVRINANGNVGIGTSTPATKLDIAGNIKIADGTQGANKVLTSDANGVATWKTPAASTDTNVYNNDGTLSANRTVAQGDKTLAFTGSAANAFSVDGTTLSVNASNDRVGIGTISPAAKLDIAGNIKIADGTQGANKVLTSDANGVATWKTPAASTDTNVYNNDGTLSANRTVAQGDKTLAFTGNAVNAFSVDGTTLSVDAFNNKIGIGTTAPDNRLSVLDISDKNPYNGIASFSAVNGSKGVSIGHEGIQSIGTVPNVDLNLNSKGTGNVILQNERVNATGKVGIGTVTPVAKLDIVGNIKIADGTQGANKVLTSDANGLATWKTPAASGDINFYKDNGTLTANRTVAQGDKTLAFTGSAVNAFSVDGATLSVDANNNRVGIGTAAPETRQDIRTGNRAYGLQHTDGTVKLRTYVGASTSNGNTEAGWIGTYSNHPVDLMTNDMPRVRINANGNVGIGTSSPTSKLVVKGTNVTTIPFTSSTLRVDGSSNHALDMGTLDVAPYGAYISSNNKADGGMPLILNPQGGNVGIGTTVPRYLMDLGYSNGRKLSLYDNANGGNFYGFGIGSSSLDFYTAADANKEASMVIKNTGNVGIGTISPAAKLDIAGNIKIADGTQGANKVLTSDANGLATWKTPAASGGTNIYTNNGTLSTNRIVSQSDKTLAFTGSAVNAFSVDGATFSVNALNDRVGIGTTAPETRQDIRTGNKQYGLQHTDGTVKLRTYVGASVYNGNTEAGWIGTYSNHPLDLMTNDAPRVRISESGNVGIGTSNPHSSAILDLNSTTQGFLPPRMTTTQRNSITDKTEGLVVYNTTTKAVEYFNGTSWVTY